MQIAPAGAAAADLSRIAPRLVDAELAAALDRYVADAIARLAVPGAAVAVVQHGRIVYERGFGVRELGKPDIVTPETLMMIGSTGKSMTTMMMATLVDDGKLRWDTPARSILRSFALRDPALTRRMTMQYLVCNCTGLARSDVELMFDNRPRTAEGLIRSLRQRDFTGAFGSTFRYSNQLVATGGYIAAQADDHATGNLLRDYLSAIQRRVFDPIGMASTTFSFAQVRATPNHAAPHGRLADDSFAPSPLALEELIEPLAPAGSAWSNVHDLSRYLITQLHHGIAPDGTRVVSATNLEATWRPQVEVSPGLHYGLGWMVGRYRGARLLSHNGGTNGFTSNLTLLPDADLGIAVLSNAGNADFFVGAVWQRVVELVYGQPMQADATVMQRAADAHRAALARIAHLEPVIDPAVAAYQGAYTNPALGRVTLALRDGTLALGIGALTTELRGIGNATYVFWTPPMAGDLAITLGTDAASAPALRLTSTARDEAMDYAFARVPQ